MTPPSDLDDLISTQDVIVCVGSGGVGKTTVAAAIALRAAQVGRTACVLTIDPARRLASAMGVEELSGAPMLVDAARFDACGVPRPSGRLFAMMLDTKRTWDDLVHRFASGPEQVRQILANRYYQQISTAIAGSQEFMAMEKLDELHQSRAYDVLILDTPPTRHALDFLDAPQKMLGFMDDSLLRLLTTPSRMAGTLGLGVLTSSTAMLLAVVKRITGAEVLNDISDYVTSFSGMHAGFRERAQRVGERLRAPRTSFALVASPQAETVEEALFFYRKLQMGALPFGGFVLNRVCESALTPESMAEWEAMRRTPETLSKEPLVAARLLATFEAHEALAAAHAEHIALLRRRCPGPHFWRTVPAFEGDVHDLSGLARLNERLFG